MIDLSKYKTTVDNRLFKNCCFGENSLYKNIPIEYLTEVREYFKSQNKKVRIRYRGSRTNPRDYRDRDRRMQDCVKQFADRFSVYSV